MLPNQFSRSSSEILENLKMFVEDVIKNINELKSTIDGIKEKNKFTGPDLGKISNLTLKIETGLKPIIKDVKELSEIMKRHNL